MSVLRKGKLTLSCTRGWVSILILMDVCLKATAAWPDGSGTAVSILILMDVCLKVRTDAGRSKDLASFNPYFNGCLS